MKMSILESSTERVVRGSRVGMCCTPPEGGFHEEKARGGGTFLLRNWRKAPMNKVGLHG